MLRMAAKGQPGSDRHNMTGGGVNPNLPFVFAPATRHPREALQWQVRIEPAIRVFPDSLTLFAEGSRS